MADDLKALTGLTNPLEWHAKTDLPTLMIIVRCFAYGISVALAAQKAGMSVKSVRNIYLQLRERLLQDSFAIWHKANRRLLNIASKNIEDAIRAGFFDTLAQCYFNSNCFRNFRDGKRQKRLCRKCPLPKQFDSSEDASAAVEFIDAIREFYKRLNIGTESNLPPAELFRRRAIHTATIATAARSSRRTKAGGFDYKDRTPLSFRSLLEALIADLAENPL